MRFDNIATGDQVILPACDPHRVARVLTVTKVTKTQFTAQDNKGTTRFLKDGTVYGHRESWSRQPLAQPASPEALATVETWKHFSMVLAEYNSTLKIMAAYRDKLRSTYNPQEAAEAIETLTRINASLQPIISLLPQSSNDAQKTAPEA